MSHTVHPYSHRLGIIKGWKSRWFGVKGKYREFLKRDLLIRTYLDKKLHNMYISSIELERGEKTVRVIIFTSRPGMIIGRNGEGIATLKKGLESVFKKSDLNVAEDIKIDVREVRSPESDAAIVSQMIAEGLERRLPFRRVMKQTLEKVMANRDVKGVKIEISGRLGGAAMSRLEKLKKGQIPLQTFRADIGFASHAAILPYGKLGIKVWIYRGQIFK